MSLTTYELRLREEGSKLIASNHKLFHFPGGEWHINFEPTAQTQVAYLQGADANSLFGLAVWADAVHRNGLKSVLALPYLPAARADRGVPLGAKVYADFINSLKLDHVIALDPHSDVAPALYDNLTVVPITDVFPSWIADRVNGIIVPDLGARKRAEAVAGKFNLPLYQATKHRDFATGKLSGFECEPLDREPGKSYLIVDDICDGGGTFMGLADVLYLPKENLGLWVTHGIFSKGTEELSEKFGLIACTDSHEGTHWNVRPDDVQIIPVLQTLVNSVKGLR